MDEVFRALADPTRRSLLDELFREDGQSLSALEGRFGMTRFGVMKHLKQLEDAGLVVTRRRGRQKLHFLNPVPIRLVHDRWVSKYAEPWSAALSGLKTRLEETMEKIFEIYIKTTPERLWEAITDTEMRSKYNFGAQISSDWAPGSHYEQRTPDGTHLLGEGENLEVDPPRRLVWMGPAREGPVPLPAPRCTPAVATRAEARLGRGSVLRAVHRHDLAVMPFRRGRRQLLHLLGHFVCPRVGRVGAVAGLVLEADDQPDLVGVGLAAVDRAEHEALDLLLLEPLHHFLHLVVRT